MNSHEITAKKIAEVREWFSLHRILLSRWAEQHSVNRNVLYQVLEGKSRCTSGESHRIAVLLGLKPKVAIGEIGLIEHPVYASTPTSTFDPPVEIDFLSIENMDKKGSMDERSQG